MREVDDHEDQDEGAAAREVAIAKTNKIHQTMQNHHTHHRRRLRTSQAIRKHPNREEEAGVVMFEDEGEAIDRARQHRLGWLMEELSAVNSQA